MKGRKAIKIGLMLFVVFNLMILVASMSMVAAAEPQEPVRIDILYVTTYAYESQIGSVLDQFMKEHPNIHVTLRSRSFRDYHAMLMIENAGGEQPDLGMVNSVRFCLYDAMGYLTNLDEYLKEVPGLIEDFVPGIYSRGTGADGSQRALPFGINSRYMFYNRDILEKIGKEPPETWDEVLEVARKTHRPPNSYGWLLCGGSSDKTMYRDFGPILTAYQAIPLLDLDKMEARVNTPEALKAAKILKELSDYAQGGFVGHDLEEALALFTAGKSPFVVSGMWAWAKEDLFLKMNLGDKIMPFGTDPKYNTDQTGFDMAIFEGSKNKDAAWALLKYMYQPEVMARANPRVPATLSAYEYPPYSWPRFEAATQSVQHGRPFFGCTAAQPEAVEEIWRNVQAMYLGKVDEEQMLMDMQKDLQEVLERYK